MAMPYASLSPAAAAGSDHHRTSSGASLLFPSSPLPFCRSSPLSGGGGEEAQMNAGRWRAPFTAAQYEELEQQALIYKYLVAGMPVPPDLLLPIRRGIDSLAARFYHHPASLGYGSYFGKKLDPEPGRCRRTDGKKWRCSKEAAPDSKYCERHMHRGRNRSRKPVETQLVPQSQPPAVSTVPSLTPPANGGNSGGGGASNFHNHSLYPAIGGNASGSFAPAPGSNQLHMDNAATYATGGGSKDLRYAAYGVRSMLDEHNPFQEASGTATGLGMDTSMDNSWRMLPSQTSSFPLSSYPQLGALGDLGKNTISSLPKVERQPLSFFGSDFGAVDSAKHENQTLRPFFDEWPKARDSWSDLADDSASLASFSATQLSISIPMASSDFSTTSSRSPNDE